MIRRSHIGLSSTYCRLLIGLCIVDIISSSSFSFLAIWVPSELNYYDWSAIGTVRIHRNNSLAWIYCKNRVYSFHSAYNPIPLGGRDQQAVEVPSLHAINNNTIPRYNEIITLRSSVMCAGSTWIGYHFTHTS